MTVLVLTDPVTGTVIDSGTATSNNTALRAVINGGIDNNNFAAGKIFDPSKLMQNGAGDRQALLYDAASTTWKPSGGVQYRKLTSKQVANTLVETDLLNGEITIAAGLLGVNGRLRLTAEGDLSTNTGGTSTGSIRLKLKLGGTTLLDTNALGSAMSNSASRFGWKIVCEIQNLGATNSQWSTMRFDASDRNGVAGTAGTNFATGEGVLCALSDAAGSGLGLLFATGGGASAVDTTAGCALVLTVINPIALAGVDVTLKSGMVEIL